MRINGRTTERLNENVENYDERIAATRNKLLLAIAARLDIDRLHTLGTELRPLNERRERWIAEGMERRFAHLTAAFE